MPDKKIEDTEMYYQQSILNPYPKDSQSECAYKKGFYEAWEIQSQQPKYDGKKLIGTVRKRFKDLIHKNWDWRSFYNGWIEGRVDMLQEIKNKTTIK